MNSLLSNASPPPSSSSSPLSQPSLGEDLRRRHKVKEGWDLNSEMNTEYYKGSINSSSSFPHAERVSSQANYIDQVPKVTITKIVLSLLAFLGFLGYLFVGFLYMSDTYCPKSKSLQVILHSLTTSNFHAKSTHPLNTTKWEATLTIQNYHKNNLRILVSGLETLLHYKNYGFSCASGLRAPMEIGSLKQRTVKLNISNSACAEKPYWIPELNGMAIRERRRRRLRLSLEMKMVISSAMIQSAFGGRFTIVDYRSLDVLDVEFLDGGNGRLVRRDVKMWMNSTLSTKDNY